MTEEQLKNKIDKECAVLKSGAISPENFRVKIKAIVDVADKTLPHDVVNKYVEQARQAYRG